jgi:hypothetical protein
MTAEERARTLTGRHQISDDGRHLVDGVPYGRPYLRHPNRPAVRIPPRKRRRLDDAEEEAEVGLLTEIGDISPAHTSAGLLTNGDTSAGSDRHSRARSGSKTVHFQGTNLDGDEDSEEADDNFAPEGEQDDDIAMDDDSDDDSDSDSDASSASDTSSSGSDSDDTSSDSDSDSDSSSDASAPPEVRSSKGVLGQKNGKRPSSPKHVTPGRGRSATHTRNSRRTKSHRLRHLKEAGKLPPEADLKALDQYENNVSSQNSPESGPSKPFSTFAGKRKRIDDEDAARSDTELEQRKQQLMARFGNDTSGTMVQAETDLPSPISVPAPSSTPTTTQDTAMEEEQPTKKETPKRRMRPDTTAIGRILARQAMVRQTPEL